MKLRLSFYMLAATLLVTGAFFSSCTQTDTPSTATKHTDTFADISGLTAGTTYKFNITGGATGSKITGVSSYTDGTVRVFWTRAAGDSSQITAISNSTASDAIMWSPAKLTSKLRLYETADLRSGHPSGLVLGDPSTTASVSQASTVDLVLASTGVGVPGLALVSPDDNRSKVTGGKATDFGTNPVLVIGGLAKDYYSSDLGHNIPATGAPGSTDISTVHDSSSLILQIRTAGPNSHYARVEVIPQATTTITLSGTSLTGNFLWGDSDPTNLAISKRFVDVNVTYQTTLNAAYAGRPGSRSVPGTIRKSTGAPINLN